MAERRTAMNNELMNATQTPSLLEIRMDSKTFPRISSYPKDAAIVEMSKIITKAYLYRGQVSDPQQVFFISSSLYDELIQDEKYGAANITFQEISVVVRKAILEEDIFISVSTLYRAILSYVKGEGHLLQLQARERLKVAPGGAAKAMIEAYAEKLVKSNKSNKL